MKINVRMRENGSSFKTNFCDSSQVLCASMNDVLPATTFDYDLLNNKPSINSVTLEGALSARDLGLGNVYYDTKENWDFQQSLVAEESALYIYSNAFYEDDGNGNLTPMPSIKIGDGSSYLIDLPFISDQFTNVILNHIANSNCHITDAEREFWNNKVSSYLDEHDEENLVLSKTFFALGGDVYNG